MEGEVAERNDVSHHTGGLENHHKIHHRPDHVSHHTGGLERCNNRLPAH